MARNVDVDDDLFHDLHAPRKLQLAVMVSFKEVLDIDDQNIGDNWRISLTYLTNSIKLLVLNKISFLDEGDEEREERRRKRRERKERERAERVANGEDPEDPEDERRRRRRAKSKSRSTRGDPDSMSHRMSKLNLNENEDNNSLDVSLSVFDPVNDPYLTSTITKNLVPGAA